VAIAMQEYEDAKALTEMWRLLKDSKYEMIFISRIFQANIQTITKPNRNLCSNRRMKPLQKIGEWSECEAQNVPMLRHKIRHKMSGEISSKHEVKEHFSQVTQEQEL